jgi:hypothetical protein
VLIQCFFHIHVHVVQIFTGAKISKIISRKAVHFIFTPGLRKTEIQCRQLKDYLCLQRRLPYTPASARIYLPAMRAKGGIAYVEEPALQAAIGMHCIVW